MAWQSGVSSAELPDYSGAPAPSARHSRHLAAAQAQWAGHAGHAGHDLAVLAAFDGIADACASPWPSPAGGASDGSASASPGGHGSGGSLPAAAGRAAGGACWGPGGLCADGGVPPPLPGDLELLPLIDFDWGEEDPSEGLPANPFCGADALCTWSL